VDQFLENHHSLTRLNDLNVATIAVTRPLRNLVVFHPVSSTCATVAAGDVSGEHDTGEHDESHRQDEKVAGSLHPSIENPAIALPL
jgi:hypothetical protein